MSILHRLLVGVAVVAFVTACGRGPETTKGTGVVSVTDVHRFAAVWPKWSPSDSTCDALRPYWNSESPGLAAYRRQFHVSFGDLCDAVRKRPQQYAQLVPRLEELDSVASDVRAIYSRFNALHPLRNNPAVYLVVGTGISAGSTVRGREPAILIGMERNRSSEGLPGTIAHELVHTQQQYPMLGSWSGGPRFLRGTLLRLTITEGAADFIAELVTGKAVHNEYGEAHERELWTDFQKDERGKDYDRWLYNGWNRDALGERPPDIAYWVGYRIVRSYYERAEDKSRALDDILTIRDFGAFLRASGYDGGASTGEPQWQERFGYDQAHLHTLEVRGFGYPWVPVGFGRDTVWLPFDTGNMVGLTVDSATFGRLRLPCSERWNRRDSGGRLISTGCTAHGARVDVFGAHYDSLSVFEFFHPSLPGLVGPAQLPGTRFTIDYARLLIATDSNTVGDIGPPFEAFPLVRSSLHPLLILTYAQVQGTDVLVEIDTGKSRTTIDRSLVEALGLRVTDQGAEVGNVRLGPWSWTVGSARVVDTSGTSAGLPARIALGIGSDVLRDFVLSVDYRSGHLWLASRN